MTERFSARLARSLRRAATRTRRPAHRLGTVSLIAAFLLSIVGPAAVLASPPTVAVGDAYAVAKNVTLTVAAPGILGNDAAGSTYADLLTSPNDGFLNLSTDGSFTYEPDAGFVGADTFTYAACTGPGSCDPTPATVTITVSNTAPVAVADSKTVLEDSSATTINAMANDTDANGDPIRFQALHQPVHGTVTVVGIGSAATFRYTPNANYHGTDTFTYSVKDATLVSALATVTVTVTGINDAPTFTAGSDVSVNEGSGSYSATWATAVSSGPGDSDVVSFDVSNDDHGLFTSQPAISAAGTLTFTTAPFANGSATVSVTIHDDGGTANGGTDTGNSTQFAITVNSVNDAPGCGGDSVTLLEDGSTDGDVGGLCNDPDGDGLSYAVVTGPTHGDLQFAANGSSYTYTPAADFHGTDSFDFSASDGSTTSGGTVVLHVDSVDDAPSFDLGADQTVDEDAAAQSVTTFLTDASAGPGNESSQTLSIDVSADDTDLFSVQPAIDGSGELTYTPAANAHGTTTVTVTVSDDGGTSDGGVDSTTHTFTITIDSVNDDPTPVDDSYSTDEDSTLTIDAPGIIENDLDVDGEGLFVDSNGPADHGSVHVANDGSFEYTPDADFHGVDSFRYTVSDGHVQSLGATVTITVGAVNDAPIGSDDSYSTDEDTALVETAPGFLANDFDADGDSFVPVNVSQGSNGSVSSVGDDGHFTYTPNPDFFGTDAFTYQLYDGNVASAPITVTVTVAAVDDGVAAVDDDVTVDEDSTTTIDVLENDFNPDPGDTLIVEDVSGAQHGSVAISDDDLSVVYTPDANYNGSDSFSYAITDGQGNFDAAAVTITVTAGNDAPVGTADAYTTDEDTTLTVDAPGVLANDGDIDGDVVTIVDHSGASHGDVSLTGDGGLTYAPDADFNGTDSFTYTPNDGTTDGAPVTVTITVTAVNDAPVGVADTYTTDEDATLTVDGPGVLGNDTDVDLDALSVSENGGASHGTIEVATDGGFTYTPEADFNGTDTFTYAPTDGTTDGAPVTVTITVTAVNDAPTGAADAYSVDEDGVLTVDAPGVLANDTDLEEDVLTIVGNTAASHGDVSLTEDGGLTYTPAADFSGTDSFTYTPNDGSLDGAPVTVTITVNAVDDAPTGVADSYTMDEDGILSVEAPGVLTNDIDLELDSLSVSGHTDTSHGDLTLTSDGEFTYTPDADFNGTDTFTYVPNDGSTDGTAVLVTITVNPINDAPVGSADAYTTDEDATLTVDAPGVLANDGDPDEDSLTVSGNTNAGHGEVSLTEDGGLTYTPDANFSGTDSFTYTPYDGTTDGAPVTVTVTISAVDDAPVGVADAYTTDEDTNLFIDGPGVLANDGDPEGDAITVDSQSIAGHGDVTVTQDGGVFYIPDPDFNGTDTFTYSPTDGTAVGAPVTVTITVTAVNDAPTGAADAYSVDEDGVLTVDAPGVLANDTDVDLDGLTVSGNTNAGHGDVSLTEAGGLTYTPDANFNGTDSFTYTPYDGTVDGAPVTVTITVDAIDDAPTGTADAYTVDEDGVLTVDAPGVLANDTDLEDDIVTVAANTAASHGDVLLTEDGGLTYTPDADFSGTDTFTYTPNDGSADGAPVTVTITVTAVNDAPVGSADGYTTDEDTTLTVDAPGVLANDGDPDDDSLTISESSDATHGTVELTADGGLTYTPDANFSGTDTFTYTPNDGTTDGAPVTVTITIDAVDDVPTGAADAYSTNEDTTLTVEAPGVLVNDTDLEDDVLTVAGNTAATHGDVTLTEDGQLTYTPDANFSGTDSFTYTPNDGSVDGAPVTVTITVTAVNDAPTGAADAYTTNEDTLLTVDAPGVLANDTDVDLDAVHVGDTSGASHGTVEVATNGGFTYQPAANFHGTDTFTYTPNDDTADGAPVTVTITVTAVNDAPTFTLGSAPVIPEDSAAQSVPGFLGAASAGPADEAGQVLSLVVSNDGPGLFSVQPAIDLATGTLSYTPAANANGIANVSVTVMDDGGVANGGDDSTTHVVTITITAVNDAPVGVADAYTTSEDTLLTVNPAGVLTNDTDIDLDTLVIADDSAAGHGTVTFAPNGSFTYLPAANYNGADSFTYTMSDGTVVSGTITVSLTVTAVDDPVTGVADAIHVPEDAITPLDVLANDINPDPDTIRVSSVGGASHGSLTIPVGGQNVIYTPNANYFGPDSFVYSVTDGHASTTTATVTLTVDPVNDAPAFALGANQTVNEDASAQSVSTFLTGASSGPANESGQVLSTAVSNDANGLFSVQPAVSVSTGTLTYTPAANAHGVATVSVTLIDDGGTALGGVDRTVHTFTITINAVNDAPVGTADAYTTNEDTLLTVGAGSGLVANDTDVDGDVLTVATNTAAAHGTVTVASAGSFSYAPAANFHGTDTFTYTMTDGVLTAAPITVTVTVTSVNDAPVGVADAYTTTEDTALTVATPGVLVNDSDVDGDAITVASNGAAAHGTATVLANGTVSYTPSANFHGTDTFTYVLTDGVLTSVPITVTITVTAVNDAPVGVADAYTTNEDTLLTVGAGSGLVANDTDVDGDVLTVAGHTTTSHGVLGTVGANGTFTYTPAANFHGTDAFTYTVTDGVVTSGSITVTITVTSVNDLPVGTADAYTTTEDSVLTVASPGLLTNDSDVDGDAITVVGHSTAAHGTVSTLANGGVTYTPTAEFHGTDTFTYTVTDGVLTTAPITVTITVTSVNDAPVAVADTGAVAMDSGATTFAVLTNDTDVDGDALIVTAASVDPASGTVTFVGGLLITFTPTTGFSGAAVVTYTVSDQQGGTDPTGTLTIAVTPDTTAPVVSTPTVAVGPGTITWRTPVIVTWSASDSGVGLTQIQVQVSMDGGTYTDFYTGLETSKSTLLLKDHAYRFRVRAVDGASNTSAYLTSDARTTSMVQSTSTRVIYASKPWKYIRPSTGQAYDYSSVRRRSATLTFTGSTVVWVGPKTSLSGKAHVYIDGSSTYVTVDSLRSSTLSGQQLFKKVFSTSGTHTIRIVVAQVGRRVNIDEFVILR